MKRVGLLDLDRLKNGKGSFPNIPLMKLSGWHKRKCDEVEWFDGISHYDKVYISRVFSATPDYPYAIDADEVVRGGSGYAIQLNEGRERYDAKLDEPLPYEVEHTYPDYSLYGITDTAYGFLSRGCPRGCDFCHVAAKEGKRAYKVADLCEWWGGKKI